MHRKNDTPQLSLDRKPILRNHWCIEKMTLRKCRFLESLTSRNEYHVILIWCRCNFFQFCFSCITNTDCENSDTLIAKWLGCGWNLTTVLWTAICDKDKNLWNFLAPSSVCFDKSKKYLGPIQRGGGFTWVRHQYGCHHVHMAWHRFLH